MLWVHMNIVHMNVITAVLCGCSLLPNALAVGVSSIGNSMAVLAATHLLLAGTLTIPARQF